MNLGKKIGLFLVIVLIVIQFFRPEKNVSTASSPNAIANHYTVPAEVKEILQTSCFDCHSNNTKYPWYAEVQPFSWFLANHVKEGKENLNFDEFATYSSEDQLDYFEDIEEVITEKEMPLKSYTFRHRDAIMTEAKTALIIQWLKDTWNVKTMGTPSEEQPKLAEPEERQEEDRD